MEQNKMPQHTEEKQEDFAKRRKVIKGLVSSPILLTLANTAEAAISSHQCLENQAIGTEPNCNTIAQGQINGWTSDPVDTDNTDATGSTVDGIQGADHYCVRYASEDGSSNRIDEGYRPKGAGLPVSGSNFINQDGSPANAGVVTGNPLTASCLTSFI